MSKYDPLRHHLAGRSNSRWSARFSDIEDVLGFPLPASAYKYQAWWANENGTGRHVQQNAWQDIGWKTTNLDLERRRVTFARV